jgi:hypothetical protein
MSSVGKFWHITKYYTSILLGHFLEKLLNTSEPQTFFFVFTEGKALLLTVTRIAFRVLSDYLCIHSIFCLHIFFLDASRYSLSFLRFIVCFSLWKAAVVEFIMYLSLCSAYCPIVNIWFGYFHVGFSRPSSAQAPSSNMLLSSWPWVESRALKTSEQKRLVNWKIKPVKWRG